MLNLVELIVQLEHVKMIVTMLVGVIMVFVNVSLVLI